MSDEPITMGVCLQCGASRPVNASGSTCQGCLQSMPVVDEDRYRASKESTANQARARGHKECAKCLRLGCPACDWTGWVRKDEKPANEFPPELLALISPELITKFLELLRSVKRERFAGEAMQALIALEDPFYGATADEPKLSAEEVEKWHTKRIAMVASQSFRIADAMVKESEK